MNPAVFADARTLVEVLRARAAEMPDRRLYTFLLDGENEEVHMTYGELDRRARLIAAALLHAEEAGQRALLLYGPGLPYIEAFFGCLYAGVVAVPAYPPNPAALDKTLPRLRAIVADARPSVVLTVSDLLPAARAALGAAPEFAGVRWLATDDIENRPENVWTDPHGTRDSLAFLQYTSGSTGTPSGVMVTHGNLLTNSERIRVCFGHSEQSQGVIWLPPYHDMGLIGGIIQPLYAGFSVTLMSPLHFLQKPFRWLLAISRFKATTSGGPNFAYELCVRKTTEQERASLDLTSWALAFNGAEPIRAETLDRFARAFAPSGLCRSALYPCYGLAEATLIVSGGDRQEPHVVRTFDASGLLEKRAVRVNSEASGRRLVGCGSAVPGQTIRIVDPDTRMPCPSGRVGEIWVSGPSVARGYWGRPEQTAATFEAHLADTGDGPYLRTGDLGFFEDGELFVTGRRKDLLILRGKNHYPQDIERTVEKASSALRAGCSAAFSVEDCGEEHLVVVAEVEQAQHGAHEMAHVVEVVRMSIAMEHDIQAYAVVLVPARTIPKTSSGKIQRHACKAAFLDESLPVAAMWRARSEDPSFGAQRLLVGGMHEVRRFPDLSVAEAAVVRLLVDKIAEYTGQSRESIDPRMPLAHLGLDSLRAVQLTGELELSLGRRISPTIAYEHPTIAQLAAHLAGRAPMAQVGRSSVSIPPGESIAIVGIGCRLPSANGPNEYWRLLREGIDAITEIPAERESLAGKFSGPIPRWGGFLAGVERFDRILFKIPEREAGAIDPQQRLALEVTWEALEDAGLRAEDVKGTRTGVFFGVSTNDYSRLSGRSIDLHTATGNASSIVANRISYVFDFKGPSMAVDSACSSSLLAVHLACQSLRSGETTLAIAGGVNLILSPELTAHLHKAGLLAPDGRCKAFDARADGYVRSEGAGVIVLKPVASALADGDRIYAVIRGTAVNSDGRSNGLTAPSRHAQEAVLRAAYERANIDPAHVQYVEAHGTGTALGDPIEAAALGSVLGAGRPPTEACRVGSVKTNLGHLEAAAGVVGLIKTALALHHREIPPSLHYQKANPHIPFEQLGLRVQQTSEPWPANGRPAVAGVSSFGFGGTNAHAVLERCPGLEADESCKRGEDQHGERAELLVLSAHAAGPLRALASAYAKMLAATPVPLRDLCRAAGVRRSHHDHRLALVVHSAADGAGALATFAESAAQLSTTFFMHRDGARAMATGRATGQRSPLVYVLGGACPRHRGLARTLLAEEAVFRAMIEQCDRELGAGRTLSFVTEFQSDVPRFDDPAIGALLVFALETGVAALFRHWGITPDVVIGQGVGEVTAAHIAGVLSLRGALRFLCGAAPGELPVRTATVRLLSGATGEPVSGVEHLARAVQPGAQPESFEAVAARLVQSGSRHFLELTAEPVLSPVLARELKVAKQEGVAIASLRPGEPVREVLLDSLAVLYTLGHDVNWASLFGSPSAGAPVPALPSLPLERVPCWLPTQPGSDAPSASATESETPSWLYRVRWEEKAARRSLVQAREPATWLLFADRGGVAAALSARLTSRGERCILVTAGDVFRQVTDSHFEIDPVAADDMAHLFDLVPKSVAWGGVISMWSLDEPSSGESGDVAVLERPTEIAHAVVQELASRTWRTSPRLWFVTRAVQSVESGYDDVSAPPGAPIGATLWGFGRTLAEESRSIYGGLVDLDLSMSTATAADALLRELTSPDGEDQVAFREGKRCVPRLVRNDASLAGTSKVACRRDASYLITGGLGGLGLIVARDLAERGARRLVLMGRTSLPPRADWTRSDLDPRVTAQIARIRRIESLGTAVHLAPVDVGDETQLASFLDTYSKEGWPPIRGVVHLAGALHDPTLLRLDERMMASVFRAKVVGAWLLHRYLPRDLDFFVLFSSIAAVLGAPGQGKYAAANAFLDALARRRRAEGKVALSIDWGPWAEGAMTEGRAARLVHGGMASLDPDEGLAMFHDLLANSSALSPNVVAIHASWSRDSRKLGRSPMLSELARDVETPAKALLDEGPSPVHRAIVHSASAASGRQSVLAAPPDEREALLIDLLVQQVTTAVGTPANGSLMAPNVSLDLLGIDSLMGIELNSQLESEFGVSLPATTVVSGPTIAELAKVILEQLSAGNEAGASETSPLVLQEGGPATAIALQAGSGKKPPFFCVHPGALDIGAYLPLAGALGPDQPFYVIRLPDLEASYTSTHDLEASELTKIDALASRALDALRSEHPRGPYYLGGWSLGGVLAFEIAHLLERAGEEVALVALFDSPAPAASSDVREGLAKADYDDAGLLPAFASYLGARSKTFVSPRGRFRGANFDEGLEHLANWAAASELLPKTADLEQVRSLLAAYKRGLRQSVRRLSTYEAHSCAVPIVLFQANSVLDAYQHFFPDSVSGWKNCTRSSCIVRDVPGDHYTMLLEPAVRTLAAELRHFLVNPTNEISHAAQSQLRRHDHVKLDGENLHVSRADTEIST